MGVDGENGLAADTAVVTSAAAVASTSSKVLQGSLSRSQTGWVVDDIVLACPIVLLSSSGCVT